MPRLRCSGMRKWSYEELLRMPMPFWYPSSFHMSSAVGYTVQQTSGGVMKLYTASCSLCALVLG